MNYEIKTQQTAQGVLAHIQNVPQIQRSKDGLLLLQLFNKLTGCDPVLWAGGIGNSIIGYGCYQYQTKSGCSGRFMKTGFALRKANLVLYIMTGLAKYQTELAQLGKHKHSVSCLYITRLQNIALPVVQKIIAADYKLMCEKYPDENIVYHTG